MSATMGRSARSVWTSALAATVMVAAGAPAQGQSVRAVRAQEEARGWIGVNLDVTELHGPSGRIDSRLVIRGVVDGSPASRAGLQPGDQILRLNGQPVTIQSFTRLANRLAPGDRFRVTLARQGGEWDGWTKEVTLQATLKPAPRLVSLPGEMVVRLDSAIQRLDSLRVVISGSSVSGAGGAATSFVDGLARLMVMGPDSTRSVVLLGRVDGPNHWSTVASGEGPNVWSSVGEGATTDVTVQLPGTVGSSYRFLTRDTAEVGPGEGTVLRARENPHQVRVSSTATATASGIEAGGAGAGGFRPLMPYIVGQNRVAGAELTPLNPELAGYFQVDRGLLVTEVSEGTPAADAGLVPGDVLVRVGSVDVASLPDLRRALASPMPAGGLLVGLVRKGERIEVTLLR